MREREREREVGALIIIKIELEKNRLLSIPLNPLKLYFSKPSPSLPLQLYFTLFDTRRPAYMAALTCH